ncbi:SusE domain-containing protein [Carboxylicivirga sediminis]|uniref:SusE domain-containing protein n=1 Tax=Carboxylicivirga sediminis TaxID=2006564 RepID=A0A941F403_9BACT|nr:SusE domain-containing protein [Carboxylicivirga sediminis]MBR8535982.1 SusE domain-containing protein [Carboxylicivirga sediminis]
MKIFQYIAVILLGAVLFSSCSEDDKLTYNPELATESNISLPGADGLVFTKDDADELITFEWSATDPGVSVQVDYVVELSTTNVFDVVTTLAETSETSVDIKVSGVNNALIALELDPGVETQVYLRVLAKINENVEDISSAFKEYTTTPYETIIDYPMIYVPGAYQGWSPGAENGRLYSYNFDNVYEGIIRITETAENNGEFKLTEGPSWDVNWGGTLTADGDNYTGTVGGGDNFKVTPGTYMFRVDLDANTITLTKTDYWGIIGEAIGGWGDADDVIMHYNGQRMYWEATADFVAGGWKFRKNSSWGGDLTGDSNGNLVGSGDNISCDTPGKYHVTFDLNNMTYTFEIVE